MYRALLTGDSCAEFDAIAGELQSWNIAATLIDTSKPASLSLDNEPPVHHLSTLDITDAILIQLGISAHSRAEKHAAFDHLHQRLGALSEELSSPARIVLVLSFDDPRSQSKAHSALHGFARKFESAASNEFGVDVNLIVFDITGANDPQLVAERVSQFVGSRAEIAQAELVTVDDVRQCTISTAVANDTL